MQRFLKKIITTITMKSSLIEKLGVFLLKDGFTIKSLTRTCFDLLARKQDKILLIKVLEDANAVTKEYTDAMNTVSSYIGAVPVIIAEKAGNKLENNVLYTRFNLYTLNFTTFINSIRNKFPFVKRTQAGFTASIAGNKLRKKREEKGYSLNYLSRKVGVTSRMIDKYEKGDSEITLNKAMKIYDVFGHQVFNEINIFSGNNEIESKYKSDFSKKYIDLGFEAADTNKTPFDIIAKKNDELILTKVGDKERPDFSSLSKLLDADNLVIFKKKKPKNVPAVTKEEFLEFEKANQLIKFLKEF
jgi:putative transcriptional regulator